MRQLPNRRYALRPLLIRLGEVANRQLGALATPGQQGSGHQFGESANIAVLDGDVVTYITQAQSRHSMRTITEVGRHAMLHNSRVGKAVLSVLGDDRVLRLVAQACMPTKTPNTITTAGKLFTDIESFRARGYAIDQDEQELCVRYIAVPVSGAPTPMAISMSGPVTRVDAAFIDLAVPELLAASAELGRHLVASSD